MSSTGTYRRPIPTQVSNLNSQCEYAFQNKEVLLEKLVDDCFKYSINQLNDTSRSEVVRDFAKYVVDLHCHENLSFLIEIFKYEYYYDKIMYKTERATKRLDLKHRYLNLSLGLSIRDLPYPRKRTEPMFTRKKSFTGTSVVSEDHEPMSVFASTIDDDLEGTPHGHEMNNVWDNLMETNVSDSDFEDDSEVEDEEEEEEEGDLYGDRNDIKIYEQDMITSQWNLIMTRYVHHNSPEQINLSNSSCKKIKEEDRKQNVFHSPIVLLPAKDEVLRLIEENAYHQFVNSYREKDYSATSPLIQPKRVQDSPSLLAIDDLPKSRLIQKSASANISPVLAPTTMNVPKLFPKKNKTRFLYLSSSTNNLPIDSGSNSSSSSASSLSNILDHLKLNTNQTNSPLNASPVQTPNQSQTQSVSTSPLDMKEDKLSKFGKIWRTKKST